MTDQTNHCRLPSAVFTFKMAVLVFCGLPAYANTLTWDITSVRGNGILTIDVLDQKGNSTTKTVGVSSEAGDNSSTVAAKIAAAFGQNTTSTGAKVSVQGLGGVKVGGDLLIFGSQVNGSISYTLDSEAFLLLPETPAAVITFAADLLTSNTVLLVDSTINAGFATGLPPVSVAARAGETISDLTNSLEFALSSAGYVTTLLDPNDIQVFSDGAANPTEFDFSLNANVAGSSA